MNLGFALRRFGEEGMRQGGSRLLVDLSRCAYMDSTFLGTLLLLKRNIERQPAGRFGLVAPSRECQQLLDQMGLDDVFPVATEEELAADCWTALSAELDDPEAFQLNVVDAHFELASLPGRAGEPFKKVARFLAQDMETRNARRSAGVERRTLPAESVSNANEPKA
jgi:anti-anti-sigma factor